jgi:hypothetical protein
MTSVFGSPDISTAREGELICRSAFTDFDGRGAALVQMVHGLHA